MHISPPKTKPAAKIQKKSPKFFYFLIKKNIFGPRKQTKPPKKVAHMPTKEQVTYFKSKLGAKSKKCFPKFFILFNIKKNICVYEILSKPNKK